MQKIISKIKSHKSQNINLTKQENHSYFVLISDTYK